MINADCRDIKCEVQFILNNKQKFTLNTGDTINLNNYVKSLKLNEVISANGNIPVGVNSSNTLDIEIVSVNKALIPDNEDSVYYGYMNDTAKIIIKIFENDVEHYMGKYYVNTWKSNISNVEPNKVVISATNIMSKICKMETPDIEIGNETYIEDYLMNMFNEINSKLEADEQLIVNKNNIDFSAFPLMQYSNVNTENVGNTLNGITQATLTNVFITRDNIIKTDYSCDDSEKEAEYEVTIMTSAQLGGGKLVNYDGVKAEYSKYNIKETSVIASLYDEEVEVGDNTFSDIKLSGNVFKINRIDITPKDNNVFVSVKSAKYNKNKISIIVEAEAVTTICIKVYGQTVENTMLTKECGGKNKLEISNNILDYNYIDKYIDNMAALINIKNNSLTVSGYITPSIKLGDIVFINAYGAMNVSGYYKVVGLDWEISCYCKCTMTLIKTFEMKYDIDSILFSQTKLLQKRINGQYVDINNLEDISDIENDYLEKELSTYLTILRVGR